MGTSSTKNNKLHNALKKYLNRFYVAKQKQDELKERLAFLRRELQLHIGDPDVLLSQQIGSIETSIYDQLEEERRAVRDIMDILDFLPPESVERRILEYRYIDCKPWEEIYKLVHYTRSPCHEHHNQALTALLTYKRVRDKVEAYEARMKRYASDNY